jgi:hypothetical protein
MKLWHKFLLAAVLIPALVVGGYAAYLAATYINETVVSGSGYGFSIGSSKQHVIEQASALREAHPNAVIYIDFGPRAGDRFTVAPTSDKIDRLRPHDQWSLQLDGPTEFFNTIRLTFQDGRLVEIHRHRKYFELP